MYQEDFSYKKKTCFHTVSSYSAHTSVAKAVDGKLLLQFEAYAWIFSLEKDLELVYPVSEHSFL